MCPRTYTRPSDLTRALRPPWARPQMDGELERYHKTNSGLDLTISNLRLKQAGLQAEVLTQRKGKADSEGLVRRLQHDLTGVVAVIQEPKALKERVKALFQKYCSDER